MNAITSREVILNFSAVAARVAAGEELTVTRYGKPVLKLVQLPGAEPSAAGSMQQPLGVQVVNSFLLDAQK